MALPTFIMAIGLRKILITVVLWLHQHKCKEKNGAVPTQFEWLYPWSTTAWCNGVVRAAHWARSSGEQEQLIHVTNSWTNEGKPREIEDLRKEAQKERQASTLTSNSTDPNPIKHLRDVLEQVWPIEAHLTATRARRIRVQHPEHQRTPPRGPVSTP